MKTNRKYALIAGLAIVVMAVAAGFSFGYAHSSLVVPQNMGETIKNLKSSMALFQLEIVGWTVILVCDILAAWAMYRLFRDKNQNISVLMGGTRMIYATVLAVAIMKLIQVSMLLNDSTVAKDEVMLHLNSFESTWSFGLIIFGFHLLFLGILVLQSHHIHNVFGILLIFAGVSYTAIHGAKLSMPDFESQINSIEMIFSAPMALGEIGFAVLLLIQGANFNFKKITIKQKTNTLKTAYEGQV